MSEQIGIALLAVVCGLVAGLVVAGRRQPASTGAEIDAAARDAGAARVEARLEVQAAELRRLADAAAARDLGAEQMRAGVEGAARAA